MNTLQIVLLGGAVAGGVYLMTKDKKTGADPRADKGQGKSALLDSLSKGVDGANTNEGALTKPAKKPDIQGDPNPGSAQRPVSPTLTIGKPKALTAALVDKRIEDSIATTAPGLRL